MKKKPRTPARILSDIMYEDARGLHPLHLCKCGELPARGKKCLFCLREELREVTRK